MNLLWIRDLNQEHHQICCLKFLSPFRNIHRQWLNFSLSKYVPVLKTLLHFCVGKSRCCCSLLYIYGYCCWILLQKLLCCSPVSTSCSPAGDFINWLLSASIPMGHQDAAFGEYVKPAVDKHWLFNKKPLPLSIRRKASKHERARSPVLQLLLSAEPIADLMKLKNIQSWNIQNWVKLPLRSSKVYYPNKKERKCCRFLVMLSAKR